MTSRDPERSMSWPQYIWGPLSRQRLEIRTWCQWTTNRKWRIEIPVVMCQWSTRTYRKWLSGNQMVTWPMTSRDPIRSRSWPQYAYGPVSRKRLEILTSLQWTTNRKWPWDSNGHVTDDSRPLSRQRLEIRTWNDFLENNWPRIRWRQMGALTCGRHSHCI